jgi:hypothetical protein
LARQTFFDCNLYAVSELDIHDWDIVIGLECIPRQIRDHGIGGQTSMVQSAHAVRLLPLDFMWRDIIQKDLAGLIVPYIFVLHKVNPGLSRRRTDRHVRLSIRHIR